MGAQGWNSLLLFLVVLCVVSGSNALAPATSLALALLGDNALMHRRSGNSAGNIAAASNASAPAPCPEACSVYFVKECIPQKTVYLQSVGAILHAQFMASGVSNGYAFCRRLADGPWSGWNVGTANGWDGAPSLEVNGCPRGCGNTLAMHSANGTQGQALCPASSGGSSLSLHQLPLQGDQP